MDHPTDYFVHQGYRKLVLRLLIQTMSDLQLKPGTAENDRLIREAREWVAYRHDPNSKQRQGGLTFSDCFYALGQASDVDRMRTVALEDPQRVARAVTALLDSMNVDEAVFAQARETRHAEHSTTAMFDSSWLFSGRAERGESRG